VIAPLLVSLHLPKTAGTSFADALLRAYGTGLRLDYSMLPMQVPRGRRNLRALAAWRAKIQLAAEAKAVHGHFLPVSYLPLTWRRPVTFITWLREPVQRLASHYEYWRREYRTQDPTQPLRNRMLAEDWTFERFALGPELRNVYRQYLWGFAPERFAFVGVAERYDDEIKRLGATIGLGLEPGARKLENPERAGDYRVSAALRARILAHHAADAELYAWALRRSGQKAST
jgi:hypothetical protein